ncbi:SCO family protein [Bacillus horti]|uniref:Protein SCO1/2 n=1 Tax=Caldalkalibacillus horti TaxID=77523 RepID=A0ABT9VW89_9BACI|nr:SCO family protein [Bacillus horti]MDQ0165077.1 protein SCO1/2 [Bacillus horti]
MNKKLLFILGGIVLLVLLGGILWIGVFQQAGEPLDVLNQIEPFTLEDVMVGDTYNSDNDKIKLLSFIFINCPDGVCPTTMIDYKELEETLKDQNLFGDEVELLSITFDPERDTTELLREYGEAFQVDAEGWRVLRGSEEEIKAVADGLKFFYGLNEDGTGYHSTTMFLLDADHQVRGLYLMSNTNQGMDQEAILEGINKLVKE